MGFRYEAFSCRRAKTNMKSVQENEEVVDRYLEKEVELDRVLGPLDMQALPMVHINRSYPNPTSRGNGG